MRTSAEFPATRTSVAAARRFITTALADLDPGTLDTVVLMVSELATNCVRHAQTGYTITVRCSEDEVRVEVTDGGAGHARVRHPEPHDTHGRGLHIVSALATSWGVDEDPKRRGKTAWFRLAVGARPADRRR